MAVGGGSGSLGEVSANVLVKEDSDGVLINPGFPDVAGLVAGLGSASLRRLGDLSIVAVTLLERVVFGVKGCFVREDKNGAVGGFG